MVFCSDGERLQSVRDCWSSSTSSKASQEQETRNFFTLTARYSPVTPHWWTRPCSSSGSWSLPWWESHVPLPLAAPVKFGGIDKFLMASTKRFQRFYLHLRGVVTCLSYGPWGFLERGMDNPLSQRLSIFCLVIVLTLRVCPFLPLFSLFVRALQVLYILALQIIEKLPRISVSDDAKSKLLAEFGLPPQVLAIEYTPKMSLWVESIYIILYLFGVCVCAEPVLGKLGPEAKF